MKKVIQRKHYLCLYENDQITEQILQSVMHYDTSGNLLEHTTYSPENDVTFIEQNTYDGNHLTLCTQEDLFNETFQKTEFAYEDGKLSRRRDFFSEEDYVDTLWSYDAEGREVLIEKTDNDNASHGRTEISYEGNKQITKEYDEDGALTSVLEEEKDEKGRNTESTVTTFLGRDEIVTHEERTYSPGGDLATLRRYRNDNLALEINNTFDEKGNRIKAEIRDHLNPREVEHTYEYDDHGHVIREEYSEEGFLMQVNETTYDEHGEVIEETFYRRLYEDYFEPSTNRFELTYAE